MKRKVKHVYSFLEKNAVNTLSYERMFGSPERAVVAMKQLPYLFPYQSDYDFVRQVRAFPIE